MNNQNFYLRLIALLMIIMAVFFYNGTVKDKEQEQSITDLTAQVQKVKQNPTVNLLTVKKVQLQKKHLMILTMYTKTVHMKAPVQDTAELSLYR